MSANLKQAKKSMREQVLARRDALPADSRRIHSESIHRRLLALPGYRAAKIVAAYASFGSEPDTSGFLLEVLAAGKQLLLPRIDKANRRLVLHRVTDLNADLTTGVWGIREPAASCPQADPAHAGLMLVPGVAFTRRCERLGYGGGYYDRLLTEVSLQTQRVATAFSIQVVDALPVDTHDQRVHAVVTEQEVLTA